MDVPETIVSLVVGGILTGIGAGFRVLWTTIRKAADQCESDRQALWKRLRQVEEKIDDCPAIDCPARRPSVTGTGNQDAPLHMVPHQT